MDPKKQFKFTLNSQNSLTPNWPTINHDNDDTYNIAESKRKVLISNESASRFSSKAGQSRSSKKFINDLKIFSKNNKIEDSFSKNNESSGQALVTSETNNAVTQELSF